MTLFAAIILLLLGFLAFVSAILFVVGPQMLLQPYRRTIDYYRRHDAVLHPRDAGLPCEEFSIVTPDGISLACWFLPAPSPSRGTILYLHGVSESRIAGIPLAASLLHRGFNVCIFDARRHGESGGSFCTYGFYEKYDAQLVINYLVSRYGIDVKALGVFGNSMGAAVAIQLAAIDSRVRTVVAEAGFATLRSVFDDYQKRIVKLPFHYLRNIVIRRSESIARFKASMVSPLESVSSVRVPLLITHGTDDQRIKMAYSKAVFARAHEPKELYIIPNAHHHDMASVGGQEYLDTIGGFFEAHLPANSGEELPAG
jgi:fermentation-respiration switch protein FrsA (DUF1100 family)